MHVGVEARERPVEGARELQVVDDPLVEALAGDQQRDAGRVRRQQRRRDAAFEIVDAKGDVATVTAANVTQSNGVIHGVDTVLLP